MSNKLYLECATGISGDMTVAALLDCGANEDGLRSVLDSLNVGGFDIKITRVSKSGLDCCDFDVVLHHDNHDHDMEYLHGDKHIEQEHHYHAEHRGLAEIVDIIDSSALTDRAKGIATRIFSVIAESEAKVHGTTIDKVHFHEVGAVDSIVDVVAAAYCIDDLDIDEVIVPYLCEGRGTVRCQHGILNVPVPAVANIIAEYGIAIRNIDVEGELVTPTGAGIVGAIRTSDTLPEEYRIITTGYGAGKREYSRPSILRAMIIESSDDSVYKLETDIDDCSGEVLGYTMERLMSAGARDVHFAPVFMKKNRPAYELVVICDADKLSTMEQIIFAETTTIGIRRCRMDRSALARTIEDVNTRFGVASVKKCTLPSGAVKAYPEYETVKALAQSNGVTLADVADEINRVIGVE